MLIVAVVRGEEKGFCVLDNTDWLMLCQSHGNWEIGIMVIPLISS
jgi:hypothetical protein